MRVTSRMMVDNAIQHMSENMEALSTLQEKASTGKVIRTPADDPSVAVMGLSLRSTLATNAAYKDTANTTSDWLDANEQYMGQMVDIGTRALNLAKQGVSDTENVTERQAIATDIDGLLQNAVGVANGSHQGKYIFAGYNVNGGTGGVPPFQYTAGGAAVTLAPGITTTAGQMTQTIERGQSIPVNIDGSAANAAQVDGTSNGSDIFDRMDKTASALKNLLSHKEDANLAETISLLNHQQTVYQAVLAVGKNAIPQSLFDFLQ